MDGYPNLVNARRRLIHSAYRLLDRNIVAWLSPLQGYFQQQKDLSERRQKGTGQWLLAAPEFIDWVSGPRDVLWYSGIRRSSCTALFFVLKLRKHSWSGQNHPHVHLILPFPSVEPLTNFRLQITGRRLFAPNISRATAGRYCLYLL